MAGGRLAQILGYPKSVGQIYGFLFFAHTAQSLDDIASQLGVSKASVSNGVRQLLNWGIVRQVWVQGNRKEFLEVAGDLSTLFKAGYADFVKPRVNSSNRRIYEISKLLDEEKARGDIEEEEYEFAKVRVETLGKIQGRLETILPLLERLASAKI